jgi:serine/threonine protein kinase
MFEIHHCINNYEIKEIIDSGASASVHVAYNLITQEKCCVKIIQKSTKNTYSIQNEIQILKSVKHPKIASFIDSYETKTHFLIFQELCEGRTLFDVMVENGKLNENIAKKFFRQLIEAVNYLQEQGIPHMDTKLENIICSSDYQIK